MPAGTPPVLNPGGLGGARGSLGSQLLPLVSVLLKFRVHDFECGQEIAQEEDEERERQHEHLGRGVRGDRPGGGEERKKRLSRLRSAPRRDAHPPRDLTSPLAQATGKLQSSHGRKQRSGPAA